MRETFSNVDTTNFIVRTPSSISTPSGQHKQNSRALASLVLADRKTLFDKFGADFGQENAAYALYPCSSIRKDDLCIELRSAGMNLRELVAYETVTSAEGVSRFKSLIEEYLLGRGKDSVKFDAGFCCLVFFSPSGCDAVFGREEGNEWRRILCLSEDAASFRFVSIGPSTSGKLRACVNPCEVHELSEPSPQALLDRLKKLVQ